MLRKSKKDDFKNVHVPPRYSTSTCVCDKPGFFQRLAGSMLWSTFKGLNKIGLLKPALYIPVKLFVRKGNLGQPTKELIDETCNRAVAMIREELNYAKYRPSWRELTERFNSEVLKNGKRTEVDNESFQREFEEIIGNKFSKNNKAELLVNGPLAFGKRYRILNKPLKRVYIATWRLTTDATGREMADLLSKQAENGSDVRIVLDKNIASRQNNDVTIGKMKKAGVKIAYWSDPMHLSSGLHAKIFIADDQAILGGTNYGDSYSQAYKVENKNPDVSMGKWRDTDILFKGSVVIENIKQFANIWNEAVEDLTQKIDLSSIKTLYPNEYKNPIRTSTEEKEYENKKNDYPKVKVKNAEIATTYNYPGNNKSKDGNTLGMLKLIWGAKESVDIETPYYVRMPFFSDAMFNALDRGVKVRILTNSDISVDKEMTAGPILNSLHELIEKGAEVYLKLGDTLHSKFLQVDDNYTWVGSYNINPRSVRLDAEVGSFVKDSEFAKGVRSVFEKDISEEKAVRIRKVSDLPRISKFSNKILERYLYDHL